MERLFGTDGVRGPANVAPMTCETVLRIGQAVAHLCRRHGSQRPRIVVGRDTRLSGDMFESAVAAGICSLGADALLVGTLPTPGIAYLTRALHADAGVVISASHNPFQDNGIKLFASTGFKLSDAAEQEVEQCVRAGGVDHALPTAHDVGRVVRVDDAAGRYKESLKNVLPPDTRCAGLKMVIDCGHGAAYRVGPQVFEELGARVTAIGVSPNGENINDDCGALHPVHVQDAVRREGADLGVALDGDADRVILVDETGAAVDGDEVLAMVATDMLGRATLRKVTVVATVMSNIGLEIALRQRGVQLVRVQVGDRYVVEEMRRQGYNLGGEQSGHVILLDHATTGDGLVAALTIVRLLVERQARLSDLKRVMVKYPQVLLNVKVRERRDLDALPAVRQTIERIQAALHDRGRVLVRFSGTEPLVRVMVEGERAEQVRVYAEEIAAAIRAHMPA